MKSHNVSEVNGFIYLWHHAEGVEPTWKVPELEQITKKQWAYRGRTEHHINAHIEVKLAKKTFFKLKLHTSDLYSCIFIVMVDRVGDRKCRQIPRYAIGSNIRQVLNFAPRKVHRCKNQYRLVFGSNLIAQLLNSFQNKCLVNMIK